MAPLHSSLLCVCALTRTLLASVILSLPFCHDMACKLAIWRAEIEWPRQVAELLRKHGELALGYITQVSI